MPFNSFSWISEIVSLSLQSYCFFLFQGRKSLQLLMVVLCLNNLSSIATHTMPWPYFYQLYFGRIIVALVALWAVADVACYPEKPHRILRLPVVFAALLVIPYWPMSPENGPAELEQYRWFCFGLAIFILALHTIFLVLAHQSILLQLLLLATLAIEATGAIGMLRIGYHPQLQMFYWWIALVCLGSFSKGKKSLPHPVSLAAPAQYASNTELPDVWLRLPLPIRLSNGR